MRNIKKTSGFALISTITIMMLLLLIAIAMLSFSNTTIRSEKKVSARAEAQANARLALMFAIGELQKQMGPDQRISASSNIISTTTVTNPHWTGVWDSWHAGSSSAGSDLASEHNTISGASNSGIAPTYLTNRSDHFRGWLLSLNPDEVLSVTLPNDLTLNGIPNPTSTDTAIRLVGEGSLGSDASSVANYVSARLLSINAEASDTTPSGRYGWWIGDQSQKATIIADTYNDGTALTDADYIYRSQAPGSMGTNVIQGLENVIDETQLDKLPSYNTLDLVDTNPAPPVSAPNISQQNFHNTTTYNYGVLADVREGGLKRDLSTILEREINITDDGDEFMLYKFGNDDQDRVPIQDLAAYYQLYQNDPNWSNGRRGGVIDNSSELPNALQIRVPDYGNDSNRDKFLRQYTSLYKSPVPVRVQFVLGVGATEITQAERDYAAARRRPIIVRPTDKYKMLLGVKPVVSLWNPNNVPLVMGRNASQIMKVSFPPFALRWKKYRAAGSPDEYQAQYLNLNYAITNESTGDGRARSLDPYIMQIQFARNSPIVFQPGEVKMFSIPINATNFLESGGDPSRGNRPLYQAEEFFPDGFYVTSKSAVQGGVDVPKLQDPGYAGHYLVFGDGDRIDMEVVPEAQSPRSRAVSNTNEVRGSGFHFWMTDSGFSRNNASHFRNYQFISRYGGGDNPNSNPNWTFNRKLILSGFPGGAAIPYEGEANALTANELLAATAAGEAKALLHFSMMAGCEKNELNAAGAGSGRRTAMRPFTHGSILSAPQISGNDKSALYDYSWEWQVNKINALEEAFHDDGNSRGFYGGGYTSEDGAANVVQQYLPVLPPMSIASLSSAHLGGFSLANAPVVATGSENIGYGYMRDAPRSGDYRQVTATGQGGLAPHTLQATGNSYAHPNIPADQAFNTYTQLLNMDTDTVNPPERTYADHSYLVNKALWDEYFFSSITPLFQDISLQGVDRSATQTAEDFLFNDAYLPNRRMIPYTSNLSQDQFDDLETEYSLFSDGFADKIASHMTVVGSFNVNSTSVEAWKVLFSSLREKAIAYLEENAETPSITTPTETPVAPGLLPNAEPIVAGSLSSDSNDPIAQWASWRSISDDEIEQLAKAMVKQVKLRGPFLSLSEFVNRRLDDSNLELSVKGALQAAIDHTGSSDPDDPEVMINAAFRENTRILDAEVSAIDPDTGNPVSSGFEFPEALNGPIAYGSTPYIDQADILRHMGSILTPRGDTFVIRAYGDSIDGQGRVQARAWCEAVVQRTPDYVDNSDEAHLKQSDLISSANLQYGRRFVIIRFRWLNANEV